MNKLTLFLIYLYQLFFSPLLKNILGLPHMCRFVPSCSEYARHSIRQHGVITGVKMSFLRILSCQPFAKISI